MKAFFLSLALCCMAAPLAAQENDSVRDVRESMDEAHKDCRCHSTLGDACWNIDPPEPPLLVLYTDPRRCGEYRICAIV
jgi:hypothetical protein